MLVQYENDLYRVLNLPVRETLMADLRSSRPTFKLTLQLFKDPRVKVSVAVKDVIFQFEM